MAVGTLTSKWSFAPFGRVIRLDFVTSSSALSGNAVTVAASLLRQVKIIPTTGGATQPTDAFDVVLADDDNLDVLGGRGADSTNGAPTLLQFDPPVYLTAGTLDVQISNAGSNKSGAVEIVISS